MLHVNILLILLLWIIPTIGSILMSCYSNAQLILPSSFILYNNLTLESCQCLTIYQNISGFQYDNNDKSCYTFGNDSSRTNIRIKINSQVCFVNGTTTSYPEATTVIPTLPYPPITISTQLIDNNYFPQEIIWLTNNVTLKSLSIIVNVPKILGVSQPISFTSFWFGTVNATINETGSNVMYIFELNNGSTIVTGQWQITVAFHLNGQVRSTSNDTYTIRIQSYQNISGHF